MEQLRPVCHRFSPDASSWAFSASVLRLGGETHRIHPIQ